MHHRGHRILLLDMCQCDTLGNAMPLVQATATAGGGGMPGDKYRMAVERGLLAIVGRDSRCQTGGNELPGMQQQRYPGPGFLQVTIFRRG